MYCVYCICVVSFLFFVDNYNFNNSENVKRQINFKMRQPLRELYLIEQLYPELNKLYAFLKGKVNSSYLSYDEVKRTFSKCSSECNNCFLREK